MSQDSILPVIISHSPSLSNLIPALIRAQANFKEITKNSYNPFFKSNYVDLHDLIDATKEALAAENLAVFQPPSGGDGKTIQVLTLLAHSSGEFIQGVCVMPVPEAKAQSAGSAITYARRYSYQAILNLSADVDDDGEAASDTGKKKVKIKASEPTLAESDLPNEKERGPIYAKLRQYSEKVDKEALKAWVLKRTGSKDVKSITKSQWAETFDALDKLEKDGSLKSIE